MSDSGPAKFTVTNIPYVGIICKDVQKTIEAYWNILGIGPWSIFEYGSPEVADLKYRGKPGWGRFKVAVAQTEPIGIELIEPLEGNSIYTDWLDEHGEGLHHLSIVVEDMDIMGVEKELAHQGFPSIQSGHLGPDDYFSYFDMRLPLSSIIKVCSNPGGVPKGAKTYPEDPKAVSPSKLNVSGLWRTPMRRQRATGTSWVSAHGKFVTGEITSSFFAPMKGGLPGAKKSSDMPTPGIWNWNWCRALKGPRYTRIGSMNLEGGSTTSNSCATTWWKPLISLLNRVFQVCRAVISAILMTKRADLTTLMSHRSIASWNRCTSPRPSRRSP